MTNEEADKHLKEFWANAHIGRPPRSRLSLPLEEAIENGPDFLSKVDPEPPSVIEGANKIAKPRADFRAFRRLRL